MTPESVPIDFHWSAHAIRHPPRVPRIGRAGIMRLRRVASAFVWQQPSDAVMYRVHSGNQFARVAVVVVDVAGHWPDVFTPRRFRGRFSSTGTFRIILQALQPAGPYMDMFTIVRPEHLNHFGKLFGGQMLKWIDEYAYLVAVREFPGEMLVTRAMDDISFTQGVHSGSVLRFHIERADLGETSVTYAIEVYAQECGSLEEYHVFANRVTFVCLDKAYRKKRLPAPCSPSARSVRGESPAP